MRQKWICLSLLCCFIFLNAFTSARADLISGKVVGPDGKPAPQAQVWFQRFDDQADGKYLALALNDAGEFKVEAKSASFAANYFGRILIFQSGFAPTGGTLNKVATKNTYHLQPALPISGRVLDEKNQPVAGAEVSLNQIFFGSDLFQSQYIILRDAPVGEKFGTTTNENGDWKLNAGVKDARITIDVTAPRFANARQQVVGGQETVTRLSPGAMVSGRAIYEDGRPVAGLKVSANQQNQFRGNESWGETKSAADGTFKIEGLSSGSYSIYIEAPDKDWVGVMQSVVAAAGETRTAPDLVLTKGVVIEGTVTDENGSPIRGVEIISQTDESSPSRGLANPAVSDENGIYHLRVTPGKNKLYLSSKPLEFLYPEIGSPYKLLELTVEKNETKTVPFVLKRGLAIAGTLEDDKGAPVAGVTLNITPAGTEDIYSPDGAYALSEEDGTWKALGLKPGKWKLEVTGDWTIPTPIEIVVPRAEPIAVQVQPQQYFALRGRVVSLKGDPMAGVGVKFSVSVPRGKYSEVSARSVVSDEQGWYEISKLKGVETVTFQSANKTGFRFNKGGELLENPGKSNYSDIVMSPLNAKLAGRVLDAQKQPVPGARVISPNADPKAVAITDAEGKFKLENLGQGFVAVLALHPEKGAVLTRQISDGSDVQLELVAPAPTPEPDLKRAEEILWEASESGGGDNSWQQSTLSQVLMPYDLERAAQFAKKPDGTLFEGFISRTISFLSARDPAQAAQWGIPRLNEIKNDSLRKYILMRLGLAVADQNPQLAQDLFEQLRIAAPGEGFEAKVHLLYLAQLAAKLKHPDARALVDQALAAGQVEGPDTENRGYGAMVAEALAEADAVQARRVIEALQGNDKSNALRRTIVVLARRGGKEEISTALEILERNDNAGQDERFGFAGAAAALVPALGKTDPAAALALARRVTESYFRSQALAQAALAQEDAVAKTVLREAAGAALTHQASVAQLAQIAILTYPRFPELAREFTTQALRLYEESAKEDEFALTSGQEDDIQNLAIALAQSDKMAARELLELEWTQALEDLKSSGGDQLKMGRIARAMANIDFNRALQMTRAMPPAETGQTNRRFETLRELARWLLTAPEKRPLLWNSWTSHDSPEF